MKRNTIFRLALLLTILGSMSLVNSAYAAESVVNGGFETGNLTGWTKYPASGTGPYISKLGPHSGIYCAFVFDTTYIEQSFNPPVTPGSNGLRWWNKGDSLANDGYTTVTITYSDGTTKSVNAADTSGVWHWYVTSLDQTKKVAKIRFTPHGHDEAAGGVAIDDVSIVSGIPPTTGITVTSPNGGETWIRGNTYAITWTWTGSPGAYVKIELLRGQTVVGTITSSTSNDGSYSWTIPTTQTAAVDYFVRITSTSNPTIGDSSNYRFGITGPGGTTNLMKVTSPNGGEVWAPGTTHLITWDSDPIYAGGNVKIDLLKAGVVVGTMTANTPNDGYFSWTISAGRAGTDFKVRITTLSSAPASDTSDGTFTIGTGGGTTPTITVTSPNGGEVWAPGSTHAIMWNPGTGTGANVKIDLLKGGAVVGTAVASTPNDGSYSWTISSTRPAGTNYQIRVTSTTAGVSDTGGIFTIGTGGTTPTITVTSPNGGESWAPGSTHLITWTWTGSPGANVKIELLKAGVSVGTAVASTPNDGSYSWTISSTRAPGTDYKIRVSSTTAAASDTSDGTFTIGSGPSPTSTITVTSPTGGERWSVWYTSEIGWTSLGNPGASVRIELLKAGEVVRTIVDNTPNDGSYGCKLSGQTVGSDYRVRVSSTTTSASDTSNADFTIGDTWPDEVFCDNTGASFAGVWPSSTSSAGYFDSDYQYNAAGTGADTATWSLFVPVAGYWEVFVRWTSGSNRATNAPYTIGGTATVLKNQQFNGGSWQRLAGPTPFYDEGTPNWGLIVVRLSDNANGFVIADAIKIVYRG